MLKMFKTLTIL